MPDLVRALQHDNELVCPGGIAKNEISSLGDLGRLQAERGVDGRAGDQQGKNDEQRLHDLIIVRRHIVSNRYCNIALVAASLE